MSFPPHCQSIQPSPSHSKAEERDQKADERDKYIDYLKKQLKKRNQHIDYLKWLFEYYNWQIEDLNSQLKENEDLIFNLDLQLEKRDQWIKYQANKIASSDNLINNIYDTIRESKKRDF